MKIRIRINWKAIDSHPMCLEPYLEKTVQMPQCPSIGTQLLLNFPECPTEWFEDYPEVTEIDWDEDYPDQFTVCTHVLSTAYSGSETREEMAKLGWTWNTRISPADADNTTA